MALPISSMAVDSIRKTLSSVEIRVQRFSFHWFGQHVSDRMDVIPLCSSVVNHSPVVRCMPTCMHWNRMHQWVCEVFDRQRPSSLRDSFRKRGCEALASSWPTLVKQHPWMHHRNQAYSGICGYRRFPANDSIHPMYLLGWNHLCLHRNVCPPLTMWPAHIHRNRVAEHPRYHNMFRYIHKRHHPECFDNCMVSMWPGYLLAKHPLCTAMQLSSTTTSFSLWNPTLSANEKKNREKSNEPTKHSLHSKAKSFHTRHIMCTQQDANLFWVLVSRRTIISMHEIEVWQAIKPLWFIVCSEENYKAR